MPNNDYYNIASNEATRFSCSNNVENKNLKESKSEKNLLNMNNEEMFQCVNLIIYRNNNFNNLVYIYENNKNDYFFFSSFRFSRNRQNFIR